MDAKRKTAYRYLLYQFMLDIRTTPVFKEALPSDWPTELRDNRLKYASSVAYILHNLALEAANDFKSFDEQSFWQMMQAYDQREPQGSVSHFRKLFDQVSLRRRY